MRINPTERNINLNISHRLQALSMGLPGDDTEVELTLGNESMAQGTLEGGVSYSMGYPGPPHLKS
jgi:hypothetical protein